MERRRARRHKRRLQVRFWKPPEADPSDGFTTNISSGGMFVATGAPARPGSRVRVECLEPYPDYVFHGVVVHAARVAPALQTVKDSGMGIRFLTPAEMVSELVEPRRLARPASPGAGRGRRPIRSGAHESAPGPGPAAGPPPRRAGLAEAPRTAPAERPEHPAAEAEGAEPPVYLVRFASPSVFLDVFRTQYRDGEFFVPTHRPARVGREVVVELELVNGDQARLSLPGKVARHVPEDADAPVKGMNVLFARDVAAVDDLRQVIRRLRGQGLA